MDYRTYKFTKRELIKNIVIWALISGVPAFFFYRSLIAWIVIFLFCPVFLKYRKKECLKKRANRMNMEFKELIRFLSSSLQAGMSVENAFSCAYCDMEKLFSSEAIMTKECEAIVHGIENNLVVEKLLLSLGERSGVEEINEFALVFAVANRSGGNLRDIIADTTDTINAKIEMKKEFEVAISSKKLEQRIMCVIPFGIIGYIGITSPGYFDTLYHGFAGVTIMTICFLLYVGAFVWGEKILDLKI